MTMPSAPFTPPRGPAPREIVWAILLLLLFVPFVGKAMHIDDIAFLRLGDYFGWNPLQSLAHDYPYQGRAEPGFSAYESTHPLLIPYLLKVLQAVVGPSELWLHLAFLCFPALALWSLGRLDRLREPGQGLDALAVPVLFASLPAFVVNGQNLMTDVPTLAFLLAGLAAVAAGVRDGSGRCRWLACFWLSCAVFSSYQALAFLPVLLGFVLCAAPSGEPRRRWLLPLALPVLLMGGWLLLVYVEHGIFPLLREQARVGIGSEVTRGLQWQVFWPKALFSLAMIGASLLFVLPIRFCRPGLRPTWQGGVALAAMVAVFFLAAPAETGPHSRRLALACFAALGGFGLGLAGLELRRWWQRTEARGWAALCGGWIAMSLLVTLAALPFGSARYLLPLFPVLFIVLLRDSRGEGFRAPRLAAALLLVSLLWGGAHAWADYYHAGTYRTMAAELAAFRRSLGSDRTLWYVGEWGMRHYFDQAGARYLLADSTEPRAGDYVIIPEMPRFWAPAAQLRPRLTFYASREFRSPLPLRLFNRRSGAGFYCHHWGMLPFAFSAEPDEVFIIQEVR